MGRRSQPTTMPALRLHPPRLSSAHPPPGDRGALEEAVHRAFEATRGVSDESAGSPIGFLRLGRQAATRLSLHPPAAGRAQGWAIVTAADAPDAERRAHHCERCLTAAQRFMLSLSCDGVRNGWVDSGLPDADALCAAGVDLGAAVPVGLVWWSAD